MTPWNNAWVGESRCWHRWKGFCSLGLTSWWSTEQRAITGPGELPKKVNSLKPRQNGRHFADDIFKCIFLDENLWILIKISLKFVPKGPINNILALVQIMAWRRPGDKPLSEPTMVSLLTHICVTRPQWVKKELQYIECGQSCTAILWSFSCANMLFSIDTV